MKRFLLILIRYYRAQISPLSKPRCRYIPSCSSYAMTAIERYGAIKGSLMAVLRIIRCNPFSKGGYDPVKEDPHITIRRE